jgi:uncharacterized membrane protein HdeD (DUF308 family)
MDQTNNTFGGYTPLQKVPNSGLVLGFGISSIVLVCCCGMLGLVLGIIAIVMGSNSKKEVLSKIELYDTRSFSNLKTGITCAIIGVVLNVLSIIVSLVIYVNDPHWAEKMMRNMMK